ncbi:transmembrane protein 199 [Anabrus simplex]|uniref:transmembrane protein 199 n=1 Tax=Anabrus simplex TaxID=316456 RepID=UPI0034DCE9DA
MGSIKNTSLKIKPSKKLEIFVTDIGLDTEDAPEGIRLLQRQAEGGNVLLSVADIEWLQQYLQTAQASYYLHELLQGCEISLPEPEQLPRNPELEARVQRLRKEQEAREYRAMTKNVDATTMRLPEDTISYQLKQINKQLIAVAQFIISVVAGFAFGFLGIELIVGNLDFGFRLLLGVIFALVIALAEIYFLAKKLSEDVEPVQPLKPHQE